MLTENEVRKIAIQILERELKTEGFADAKITFERDFDDEPIIRIQANLDQPTQHFDRLFASAHAIREALAQKGDERFVFLHQASPALDALEFEREEDIEDAMGNFKP